MQISTVVKFQLQTLNESGNKDISGMDISLMDSNNDEILLHDSLLYSPHGPP